MIHGSETRTEVPLWSNTYPLESVQWSSKDMTRSHEMSPGAPCSGFQNFPEVNLNYSSYSGSPLYFKLVHCSPSEYLQS